PLLLVGAVAADDGSADCGAHHHQQQRTTLGGQLLTHRRDVADAATAAAVLLRDVDPEVPGAADLEPELGGLSAAARLFGEPLAPVLRRQAGDLATKCLALLGLGELGHDSSAPSWIGLSGSSAATTASTSPAATWSPGCTDRTVTVPAWGADTVC